MVNGKKLAQLLRKNKKLIIEKLDDEQFIVTDTYIMVRLTISEFGDFFAKYNSYKSTANIPFEFEGTISSIRKSEFSEDQLKSSSIINRVEDVEHTVEITDFSKTLKSGAEARIYKVNNQLGLFNREYDFTLELGDQYINAGTKKPLFILRDDIVQAVVMPIVTHKKEESLKEELSKVCEVWKGTSINKSA